MQIQKHAYGVEDTSYKAAGELEGITKLVNDFYDIMETLPEASEIKAMHGGELTLIRKKLAFFLSGWLGGPKLFSENFGPIRIPKFHQPFPIKEPERDAWLLCMSKAIDMQDYAPEFKEYLLTQLHVPANRILAACQQS